MNLPSDSNTNSKNNTEDYRTGTLKVESIINVNKLSRPKRKPNSQKKQPQQIESEVEIRQAELGEGILHLYRDKDDFPIVKTEQSSGPSTSASTSALTNLNNELIKTNEQVEPKKFTSIQNFEEGNVVGLLAIPSYMAPCDLLNFITPEFTKSIHQIRLIRDSFPNRYISLIQFNSSKEALRFYFEFNGKSFNAFQSEACVLLLIKSLIFETPTYFENWECFPKLIEDPNLIELPTCPVCLERMDETSTGLMTILCQHTFHCSCLNKWEDGRCPVCRYTQLSLVSNPKEHRCSTCESTDDLWICLICGNVGCGRYTNGHASSHYLDTEHLYALELNTQRVWDYCGDRYVHRLIQNQQDGKLVELSPWAYGSGSSSKDKKGEMETVEDLTLLTTMMDSQKMYYEAELELLNRKIAQLNQKMAKLSTGTGTSNTSKKPDKNQTNYQKVLKELDEERQMSGQILEKQQLLEKRVHDLEKENEDLQDQVKDLMFFMDARDRVESNPSLKDADIVIRPSRK